MASLEAHIQQANNNLRFLSFINHQRPESYDWMVTVCFYAAVHIVNAHLSKFDKQYRTHHDTRHAINPEVKNAESGISCPIEVYISYNSLLSLSRRSRYLISEKDSKRKEEGAFHTSEKLYSKALRHLDKIINHFSTELDVEFEKIVIVCTYIKESNDLKTMNTTKLARIQSVS